MIPAILTLAALTAVHLPVTTQYPAAQALVDRGLLFYYAYDGGDASGAFVAAETADPNAAMAYWGEALADGPDLNTAMSEDRFGRAKRAAEKAVALEGSASTAERRYIDAMALRYKGTWTDWKSDDAAYRDAMNGFAEAAGGGVPAMLAAEAMLESAGAVWAGAAPVTPEARLALALVGRELASDPNDLMANHLCVHLYDGAEDRAPAAACARRLDAARLPPQAEHLAHMPAHYWIETGNYAAALASSERAYGLFMQLEQVPGRDSDHDRYLIHDVYVGYSAAMMLEDYASARVWSGRMDRVYGTPFGALTALRFGGFAGAYALATQTTPSDLAVRGWAALELGRDAEAHKIAVRLRAISTSGDLAQLFLAHLAERDGNFDDASRWIDRAVTTQRSTYANELIPVLPALEERGAFEMRRASFAGAAQAFRAALQAYPNDPRAVAGLAAALRAQRSRESGQRVAGGLRAVRDARAYARTSTALR